MNLKKDLLVHPAAIAASFAIMSVGAFAELKVDNTKHNERDRQSVEITADQQKLNKTDSDITKRIRQALVKDKNLSSYAKNVKIITINGEVTLKGPVKTEEEELTVVKKANLIAGNTNVINQLEITNQ